jgi:hypothetical protein
VCHEPNGLLKPASKCNKRITLRYFGIEEYESLSARYAMYIESVCSSMGK